MPNRIDLIIERLLQEKTKRHKTKAELKEIYDNMQHFTKSNDGEYYLKPLPVCSTDEDIKFYYDVIVPNYIRCGAIPKKDLIIGKTYIGSGRGVYEAKWDGEYFTYERVKFGYTYDDKMKDFEDEPYYAAFIPIEIKK